MAERTKGTTAPGAPSRRQRRKQRAAAEDRSTSGGGRPTLAGAASGMLQAIVLAAIIVVPLFFNPRTERIFEPDKIAWIICLAVGAALAAWARFCATYDGGLPRLPAGAARPLIVAALALGAVLLVSTASSIAPVVSLWGSYRRAQGLFATLALIAIFGATAHAARRADARTRILDMICISAMPVALYAVLQRFGIDTIPWSQYGDLADVRAFGPLGNAIFLGAYLAMVVPIALGRAFDGGGGGGIGGVDGRPGRGAGAGRAARGGRAAKGQALARETSWSTAHLVMAGIAVAGLLASQSRGPVIGLAAGLAAGALFVAADAGRRRLAFGALAGGAGMVGLLIILGRAGVPGLTRFGTLLSVASRTAQERLLAWDALAGAAAADPMRALFGHGPETLTFILPPYADVELARLTPTQLFDRAHNVLWEWWVAAGVVGVVAYLALYVAAFHAGRVLLGWAGGAGDAGGAGAVRDVRGARDARDVGDTGDVGESGEMGDVSDEAHTRLGGSAGRRALALSAASAFGAAAVAAGAAALVRPGLMGLAATFGATAGLVGHAVLARLAEVGRSQRAPGAAVIARPWWVVGILAALITHLVEGSLGVPTAVGELIFWILLGVLAGAALEAAGAARAIESDAPAAAPRAVPAPAPADVATAEGLIVGLGLATITYAPLVLPFGLAAAFDGRNSLLLALPVILWVCAELVAPRTGAGRRSAARLAVLGVMLVLLLPSRVYAAGPTVVFGIVLLFATAGAGWRLATASGSRGAATDDRREGAWRAGLALAGFPLAVIVIWLVALRPIIADAQLRAGLEAAARGELAPAAARFARAAQLWPSQPSYAHYTAAIDRDLFVSEEVSTAERLQAFDRAEATLERSFALHPSEALARRRATLHRDRADRAADAAERRRSLEAADLWLQEALRRDPNAPDAHAEYAALLERTDDQPAAREHYAFALDINPDRVDWWIGAARAALADGDVEAAGAAIDGVVARVPAERIDPMLSALAAEADALPVQPFEPLWSLRVRALVEARTDRTAAAAATLDELARRAPNDPRLERLRADVASLNGAD